MPEQKTGSVRRPTKKKAAPAAPHIVGDVFDLKDSVARLQEQVTTLMQPRPTDVEASIAGRCAQALDELQRRDRDSASVGYSGSSGFGILPSYRPEGFQPAQLFIEPRGPVARVLDYLRQRYSLPDPAVEAQRLSVELDRAQRYIADLEQQLEQIRGAVRR